MGNTSEPLELEVLTKSCAANRTEDVFRVVNRGAVAVKLSDISIKYWAYDTSGQTLVPSLRKGGHVIRLDEDARCDHDVSGVLAKATSFSPSCGPDATHQATVSKGSTGSNAISARNISDMWGAIASGNKRNSVWHCNDNTLDAIDQLAVSGQWSESIYIAAGRYPNEYPLIKGRPVICTEASPEIGTPGDLICVDWTDYRLVLHKPKPDDSGLAFSLTLPPDSGHLGVVGMPQDAIEAKGLGRIPLVD